MKIMSVNAGSSSLKFSLFEMSNEQLIASGYFERVGIEGGFYTIKFNGEKIKEEVEMPNHVVAVEVLLDRLISLGIISSLDEIDAVGHRVAHGGDKFDKSVVITDSVMEDIRRFAEIAPLHNPANIAGIEAVKKALPNVPMTAVFDTAFHQTMDKLQYIYSIPYEYYEKYGIRKYGFHGTSYSYVSKKLAEVMGRDDLRAVICHIGSGGSICAVKNGKCVDTSMGYSPLPGIVMGTRSGDVDPSIVTVIMDKEGLNASEVIDVFNKKSGLLGLSGISNDCRDVEDGVKQGNERCKLAIDKFVQSVVDYIAKYYVELGGIDALVFTAGIGENGPEIRRQIVDKLACLGIKIDLEKNNVRGKLTDISADDSNAKVFVIPTDEELMIAKDTLDLVR